MIGRTNVGGGENVKAEVEYQTPVITQILEGLVGKAQGANATADKILEGYSAYVGQKLLEGTAKPLDLSAIGCSKIAVGEITFSAQSKTITIPHGLGVVPKLAFATRTDTKDKSGVLYMCWYEKASYARLVSDSSSSHYPGYITVDEEMFEADGSSYINFPASTYKWVVMA